MRQDEIILRGLRENNLKNVDLTLPKHKITVFTGVSGSGKSSIVFDTVSAEAQRQLNETYSAFLRNRMPRYNKPKADVIANLSPAIVIDQKQLGGNSRSTVGTVTDINPLIRLLFSRVGRPYSGSAGSFSFNDPEGACPECRGLGRVSELDLSKLFDRTKSLNTGAILLPIFPVGSWYWKTYVLSGLFDNDKILADYTEEEWRTLVYGKKGAKVSMPSKSGPFVFDYEGVQEKCNRLFINRNKSNVSEAAMEKIKDFIITKPCGACHGARLNPEKLKCRINGRSIADYYDMEISELLRAAKEIDGPVAAPMVRGLSLRLQQMADIGLDYLSLSRETSTLSGGESQRIKMVRHLNSSLTDMLYIFDEPSIGLHPRDISFLNNLLLGLRDKGNTILVVEHNRDVIQIADYIVDVGPKAGTLGGEITYTGTPDGLRRSKTLTGAYLDKSAPIKGNCRKAAGKITIKDAFLHNLKHVTVDIPTGIFTVVAGVAGSGKSSLMNDVFLDQHPEAILIDQSAVGVSIRSTPVTYTGAMDEIRKQFAQANKVGASLFSFNSKGACPECKGAGFIYTDLAFLEPIRTLCPTCKGRRFREDVLKYQYRGKSIDGVLSMTVNEAIAFFEGQESLLNTLRALEETGLGYLTLGQPLSTLSGGECQRIKLANELQKKGEIYVMDEPTVGLHMSEVERLLSIVNRLVDNGGTVIVIEHDLDVIRSADWIIEMGPDSGSRGGRVVFEGTPAQLLRNHSTQTAKFLKASTMFSNV